MSFNFCLLFNSVTRAVFSGNQICEILHHLLEYFGLPPSQIVCFDRERKTFLEFPFWFQYLIQKFSPCQKGWRPEPFPTYLYVFYRGEMTFRFSLQMDWAWWFQHRTDPCYQVWSLHAEHIATGITPNSNFLSDLKACFPDLILEEDYQGISDRTPLKKNGKIQQVLFVLCPDSHFSSHFMLSDICSKFL